MTEIRVLCHLVNKIFYERQSTTCILTVSVTLYSSDIPFVGALCIKFVNWGYQNNHQSVSLIPKRDPGITNFFILDPGIENPILGLQSLVMTIC